MTAYLVAAIDVHEPEGYTAYSARVGAIVSTFGGQFLARGGALERLEGDWPGGRTVIIAFPDRDAALAFYRSPAYQDILPTRLRTAVGSVVVVDGIEVS